MFSAPTLLQELMQTDLVDDEHCSLQRVELAGGPVPRALRGGENIPVTVVESLLIQHPGVLEAAVVGVPDPRLGERACAIVVSSGERTPTLAELCDFLVSEGLSRHFLPERVEVVDALPKTPSRKVRKVELRARYSG